MSSPLRLIKNHHYHIMHHLVSVQFSSSFSYKHNVAAR